MKPGFLYWTREQLIAEVVRLRAEYAECTLALLVHSDQLSDDLIDDDKEAIDRAVRRALHRSRELLKAAQAAKKKHNAD